MLLLSVLVCSAIGQNLGKKKKKIWRNKILHPPTHKICFPEPQLMEKVVKSVCYQIEIEIEIHLHTFYNLHDFSSQGVINSPEKNEKWGSEEWGEE